MTHRLPRMALVVAALAVSLGADFCGQPCDVASSALVVFVRDAQGHGIADGATGTATAATDTVMLVPWVGEQLRADSIPPGTYDVIITRPGFLPWTRLGVEVPPPGCGLGVVTLQAVLTPDPAGMPPD